MVESNETSEWKLWVERLVASRGSRVAFAAAVAVLVGCAAFAFGARAHSARGELYRAAVERIKTLAAIPSLPASSVTSIQPQAQLSEGVVLTLLPQGFQPSAVTRTEGRVVLGINNRSGLRTVSLNLDHETGARLRTVAMAQRRLWAEGIELPPGRYALTEASHPSWVCILTVTKR